MVFKHGKKNLVYCVSYVISYDKLYASHSNVVHVLNYYVELTTNKQFCPALNHYLEPFTYR